MLLTDTVGFIRKLPHHLVASFRATLEETRDADLLLHVVDASHPLWEEQRLVVDQVLLELGLHEQPMLLVFNKIDLLTRRRCSQLQERVLALVPNAIFVNTTSRRGARSAAPRAAARDARAASGGRGPHVARRDGRCSPRSTRTARCWTSAPRATSSSSARGCPSGCAAGWSRRGRRSRRRSDASRAQRVGFSPRAPPLAFPRAQTLDSPTERAARDDVPRRAARGFAAQGTATVPPAATSSTPTSIG